MMAIKRKGKEFMPKATMQRRPVDTNRDIENIVPYVPLQSDFGFYVPPVLEADFDNW